MPPLSSNPLGEGALILAEGDVHQAGFVAWLHWSTIEWIQSAIEGDVS
jgi:hypothetical protein